MGNLYFQVPDARTGTGDIDALRIFGPPEAQQRLLGLLRLPARTPPSEVYAQLSAFQRQHGLTPDGACGALTLQLLHDDGAPRWSDYLSAEVLGKLFPHTLRRNLQTYAPYVLAALDAAGEGPGTADGRTMCQVALATIRAETEGFEPISEGRSLFNTEAGGREFGLYDPPGRIATRLGNTQPGDGATFKGRGFVQLTGRDNYTRIGQQLALPLGERAFLANLPEIAAAILVRFLQNVRSTLLADMAAKNLKAARKRVNGGSHGLDRFTDACTRWDTYVAPLLPRLGATGPARARRPRQRTFDFAQFGSADKRFSLPVRRDPVDLRDLPYRPPLGSLPEVWPPPEQAKQFWPAYGALVLDQGTEGACTGFGLACVVNYLQFSRALAQHLQHLQQRKRTAFRPKAALRASPRMLYEFARRYDEFAGDDYEGSSCRGALKGWHKHGVCREDDWPYPSLSPARPDWADRALDTTLGVYYRVDKSQLVDLQAAIHDVGAIYVSAEVHAGWDLKPPPGTRKRKAAPSHDTLPVIAFTRGRTEVTGAHAFALVGYNRLGFIVQNSWGPGWGAGGFAVLRYEDWLAHGMDAWAATLGVPGVVANSAAMPEARAAAPARGGASAAASGPPADLGVRHSLVLDRGLPVNLPSADTLGGLHTLAGQWPRQWFAAQGLPADAPRRVVLYAHGGLNSEDEGLQRARLMARAFLDNGCYPIFLVWKTGPLETLRNLMRDQGGETLRIAGNWFSDNVSDKLLERTLGAGPARAMWQDMKASATRANAQEGTGGGLTQLAYALQALLAQEPALEVHLVGHSAGALLLGPLVASLVKRRVPVMGAHLYAPACTVEFANEHWLPWVGGADKARGRFPLHVSLLSEPLEREDDVLKIYRKSLLYFVARGIEEPSPAPLLGMEGAWDRTRQDDGWAGDGATQAALRDFERAREALGGYLVLDIERNAHVVTRTDAQGKPVAGQQTRAVHGSFDADAVGVLRTIERILGGKAPQRALDLSEVP